MVAKLWHFRTENEYDRDEVPEIMAINLVQKFVDCTKTNAFLLLASDIDATSASRSKKGILWNHRELRQLPHLAFDCDCGNVQSRLVAIIDLSEFDYDSAYQAILNWGQALIVCCEDEIERVKEITENWVSTERNDVLAFDYNHVSQSLRQNAAMGVLRYLPPGNTRSEAIVLIANDDFLDEGSCECIELIT